MIIALDGPAGSGKSTVAKLVATRLGFAYLDTGAMYRSVAWRALEEGLELNPPLPDESIQAMRRIAADEPITFGYLPGRATPSQVFINGREVTTQIRTPATDVAVSPVSAEPGVRAALTEQQRVIGHAGDTVMEGRDIGTVVFPDAELKVFLTATAEERAHRRYQQNVEKARSAGQDYNGLDEDAILADIQRRDTADSTRAAAPLVAAADSVLLDTTELTIDEVVERIIALAAARREPLQTTAARREPAEEQRP
ncbi:MAG: (d)CMP kinase [Coriobacteriales bacterium]|jgi:cytidylate kinase|nr:(d)CMP kinase [Coriobacteriales bacterium]